ncbi:MAG: ATP-dependent Clp protease adaptor ClpS [Bacteroidales bacterium]|nr:ATP-dependent Clp protease adaptor ClpS [Bacteroidales bacterium]
MEEGDPRRKKSESTADEKFVLVLYNDDVNTFEHIIKSLIEVCGHDDIQARQCAVIAHNKGSCQIKSGPKATMEQMKIGLSSRGITAKVKREKV